ncbi:MAG: MAPEG family protein [Albidovulum sp.]|uniref:MAPEG family protein n=1 Tax=Albidovulum sp. TaxID=1872424 RepID=UPI003CAC8446
MTLEVTGLYAAVLALMMIALQILAIAARAKHEVLFGDAGEMRMILPIRRHGNFVEHVPMALIVMALAEAQGLSGAWLHAVGLLLVVSRALHPFGLAETKKVLPIRIAGIVGSWIATLIPVAALFGLI